MISVLSFGLVIGQLVEKEYIYETLVIVITFVGIFATFGGAYLGAKVSAVTAISLSRRDRIIESSVKILTNLYEINSMRNNIYNKTIDNIMKLEMLKEEKNNLNNELQHYKIESYDWQKYYSEIFIYVLNTNLKQEEVKCIEVPSFMQIFSKIDISDVTYSKKNEEGGVDIKVCNIVVDEHLKELRSFQKQLLKMEREIIIIREKIIKQFPRLDEI